jgi:beta-lactamase regulating signal transducer with metallopeptidase domain
MNAIMQALTPYQGAAVAVVTYCVTSVVLGATVFVLAALIVRFWRPLDAAARYAVWYAALIAVAAGPVVTTVMMQRAHEARVMAQVRTLLARAAAPAPSAPLAHPPVAHAPLVQPPAASAPLAHPPVVHAVRIVRPVIAIPPPLAYGASVLWLLVVLGGVARFAAGAVVLARLKRDALPVAPERRAMLGLWAAHAEREHARRARLCVSDRVDVPVAVGLFDGMVVLPRHVLDEFDPGDVDRFVLHELAHLERRDDWTTVVQRLIQVVLWINPVVHLIARRLDLEREIACDDRVAAATSDVRSYAAGLTRMAESTAWPHRGIAAPAIFVTRRQLSLRVEELLARRARPRARTAFAPAVVALVASFGAAAAAATLSPVVSVGDRALGVNVVKNARILILRHDGEARTLESTTTRVFVLDGDPKSAARAAPRGALDDAALRALLDEMVRQRRGTASVEHQVQQQISSHHR